MRIVQLGLFLITLAGAANAALNIEMVYVKGGCYQMETCLNTETSM